MALRTEILHDLTALQGVQTAWDQLAAGQPLRSYDWLVEWWKHYGTPAGPYHKKLHVLAVVDDTAPDHQRVVAIAPWYQQQMPVRGTVLRWLGSGKVCTDHLSLLCHPQDIPRATNALAEHLLSTEAWDHLELEAVDDDDPAITALATQLQQHACHVRRRPAGNCWQIALPEDWEQFLQMQSRSHRRQLRQALRRIETSENLCWKQVTSLDDWEQGWNILLDLHQRRWRSLGHAGCFASDRFMRFHYHVARTMLAAGRLHLSWIELDQQPLAVNYDLLGGETWYAYQSGIDPLRPQEASGRLIMVIKLKTAIAQGYRVYDTLRGDEPYKAHWRAQPQPFSDVRITAPRASSRFRAQSLEVAGGVASAVKAGLRPLVHYAQGLAAPK